METFTFDDIKRILDKFQGKAGSLLSVQIQNKEIISCVTTKGKFVVVTFKPIHILSRNQYKTFEPSFRYILAKNGITDYKKITYTIKNRKLDWVHIFHRNFKLFKLTE